MEGDSVFLLAVLLQICTIVILEKEKKKRDEKQRLLFCVSM